MPGEISERLRLLVAERAGRQCEYCRLHEDDAGYPHQIDHIISRKHHGPSVESNLAYACVVCNRRKGADVATIDERSLEAVRLFHPRRDQWSQHFTFEGPYILPLTPEGTATIQVLQLNATERIEERRILLRLNRYGDRG
ncbi:MAG: HNH endonuclease signature motif containing protein [Acidobacteriota bacterium]